MGKDSLIKSTTKKTATKKTANKSASKRKPAQAKTASQVGKKSTASKAKGSKRRTVKSTAKSTPKKLLFKQFVSRKSPSPPLPPDYSAMTAPPLIDSKDAAEAGRLRELLSRRFDMADIKAAAQAPVESAAPESETAPSSAPVAAPETGASAQAQPDAKIQTQAPETGTGQPQAPPASPAPSEAEPIEAAQAEPAEAAQAEPAEAAQAEPAEAAQAEPVEAAQVEPVEAAQAEPVEAAQAEPVEAAQVEPVEAEQVEPVEAEQVEPVEAAQGQMQEPESEAEPSASVQSRSDSGLESVPPVASRPEPDPVQRALKVGLSVLALIVLLVVWASITNSFKYFIVPTNSSVEIWRGDFSPAGKRFVAVLHGVRTEAPAKNVYHRDEVYPIIFTYYLNKADSFLNVEGLPDYQSINEYLQRADKFVLNKQMRNAVDVRRKHIQQLSLLYKADVEAGQGTEASLQSALQTLTEAKRLTKDPAQLQIIDQRIAQARNSLARMKKGMEAPAGPEKTK